MRVIEVAPGIFWVGAIDWNIRDFHGYSTDQGTSYNAFLILDDKITLIDTVKKTKTEEMFERIRQIVDPKDIHQVISLHTEMDHSGALPLTMHRIGRDKPVYCSQMGLRNLKSHFKDDLNLIPVENGGSLSLGKRTLTFLETRMLHWPDSMFAYLPQDEILFSSDAFGQHYAGLERFDDEIGLDVILPYARKYYANILLPFSGLVLGLVKKVQELGLKFRMVLPDHGILWRRDPLSIIGKYVEWAEQKPTRKAVVVYDTMWHSTETMADALADALGEEGVRVKLMHLRSCHRSDVITEIHDAGAVLVGSPTINNQMFPTVADMLCYMKGLKPLNKVGAAFGSYGWSGEAVKYVNAELTAMKFNVVSPGVRSPFVPEDDIMRAMADLGRMVASALPPAP